MLNWKHFSHNISDDLCSLACTVVNNYLDPPSTVQRKMDINKQIVKQDE